MTEIWTNWSGLQEAAPARRAAPDSVDALCALLRDAPRPIRVAGAGHSFSELIPGAETLISLDALPGAVHAVDLAAGTARINPGARLYALSAALEAEGAAFRNLGDINQQSFAGAAATATHGTGRALPCLSAELRAATLALADGATLRVDASDPDLLRAAQVSLGALGVMVEAEIAIVPRFRLHRKSWVAPLEAVLEEAPERWARHRNFEFFHIPFSGRCICISHDATEAPETSRAPSGDEAGLRDLRRARDWLSKFPRLRRVVLSAALRWDKGEDVVGESWRLFSSDRLTRFNEMEYHLPPDTALDAARDALARLEARRPDLWFPVEFRQSAGDDALLSPFEGGPRVSLAFHAAADEDHRWLFTEVEPILREAGGRPHWGKLHGLRAEDVAALYSGLERFRAIRRRLDPDGAFLTPAVAALLGEE